MTQTISTDPQAPLSPEVAATMEKFGITRKSVDYFFLGEYRYATLRDALAQAKRMADKA